MPYWCLLWEKIFMTEMVLDTNILPAPLVRFIHAKKFKVRAAKDEIYLTPVKTIDSKCPLLGMFAEGKMTVAKFIANKRAEKELEWRV